MQQRFHTTMSRRTLTLLGLVGLAIWLGLSGGAFAADGPPQRGHAPLDLGPLTEVTLAPVQDKDVHFLAKASEGVVPNDLVGLGATVKVAMGFIPQGIYVFTIPWSFVTLSTRAFASANEGGIFGGALYQVLNVNPTVGAIQVVVIVQASYVPQLFIDLLAIN